MLSFKNIAHERDCEFIYNITICWILDVHFFLKLEKTSFHLLLQAFSVNLNIEDSSIRYEL